MLAKQCALERKSNYGSGGKQDWRYLNQRSAAVKVQIFCEGRKNLAHLLLFVWHYIITSNYKWKMYQIFMAFSQYLNFNYISRVAVVDYWHVVNKTQVEGQNSRWPWSLWPQKICKQFWSQMRPFIAYFFMVDWCRLLNIILRGPSIIQSRLTWKKYKRFTKWKCTIAMIR